MTSKFNQVSVLSIMWSYRGTIIKMSSVFSKVSDKVVPLKPWYQYQKVAVCVSPFWVMGINRWWPLQYFHFFAENWVFLVMVCKHVGQQLVQICSAQTRGWWLLWPEIQKWQVSIVCFRAYQTTFVLCAIIETKSYEQSILHVCMYECT